MAKIALHIHIDHYDGDDEDLFYLFSKTDTQWRFIRHWVWEHMHGAPEYWEDVSLGDAFEWLDQQKHITYSYGEVVDVQRVP